MFSCADCGCVVEGGVRLTLCPDVECCCANLPACDMARIQKADVDGSTTSP